MKLYTHTHIHTDTANDISSSCHDRRDEQIKARERFNYRSRHQSS